MTKTNESGKYAIIKAIRMSLKEKNDNELPSIFKSSILLNACRNGELTVVQKLFQKSTKHPFEKSSKVLNMRDEKNALDIALDLFEENDKDRSEILKTCIQYANAAQLGIRAPSSNYPTIVAAAGIIPPQSLLSIGRVYSKEITKMDRIGKLVLKKLLKMVEEQMKFAIHLDKRCQYPLSFNTSRLTLESSLGSIPCDRPI